MAHCTTLHCTDRSPRALNRLGSDGLCYRSQSRTLHPHTYYCTIVRVYATIEKEEGEEEGKS